MTFSWIRRHCRSIRCSLSEPKVTDAQAGRSLCSAGQYAVKHVGEFRRAGSNAIGDR